MTRSNFLLVATVVAAVFGLAFLLAPSQLVALYGVTLTPQTEVIGRIAGSVISGFAIVFWGARDGNAADALKAAMTAGLVANALDALIPLRVPLTPTLSPQAGRGSRHAAGFSAASPLASRWISARLIAACLVGAVICAPKRSVT